MEIVTEDIDTYTQSDQHKNYLIYKKYLNRKHIYILKIYNNRNGGKNNNCYTS